MSSVQTLRLEDLSERLTRAVAVIAGRLARLLAQIPGQSDASLLQSQNFLRASYEAAGQAVPLESRAAGLLERAEAYPPQPIDLLLDRFHLTSVEAELLLLAAMPEEHEGYSAVLRSLHPKGESHATVGL